MMRGAHTPIQPSWASRVLGLCLVFATSIAFGCASQFVPRTELHDAPIAFVFWDAESARERAEIMQAMEGGRRGPTRPGVARLDAMGALLGSDAVTAQRRRLSAFPGRIALLHPQTLEIERFDAAPPNARPLSWSRDHQRLLFSSQHRDEGRTQLFEYDRKSGEVRKLTHGPALHLEGDYGPEGELLVSWVDVSQEKPLTGIDVRAPGGGVGETIVQGVFPIGVRWSPSGDQILYSVDPSSGRRSAGSQKQAPIIIAQAPTVAAELRPLTRGRDATYSKDGEWIVFSALSKQGWRLRRMRGDGGGRSSIGASSRNEFSPTVSPDSKHVVYVAEDGGVDRLFLRRMDGSGDRILWSDGGAAFPVW
jgi:hypothetical protein